MIIPDAVYCEAAGFAGKLGAQEIIDWQRAHEDMVHIESTHAFVNALTLVSVAGGRMPRDLGERAAVELMRSYKLAEQERALLLSDDRDVERVMVIDPDRLILLTTWDYLRQLEQAQRIQSIAWRALRECGFDNYVQVLGVLGELGLRPPIAPMRGPNVEARQRGRALLRQALKDAKP